MYAVISTSGKQYQVAVDDVLEVDLDASKNVGDSVDFDKVLMVADGDNVNVGAPCVEGGKVVAEVVKSVGGEKLSITKFRRRKHHQKVTGHRQWYTQVKITGINA